MDREPSCYDALKHYYNKESRVYKKSFYLKWITENYSQKEIFKAKKQIKAPNKNPYKDFSNYLATAKSAATILNKKNIDIQQQQHALTTAVRQAMLDKIIAEAITENSMSTKDLNTYKWRK